MKEKVCKIGHLLILLLITIMLVGACYLKFNFSSTNFEEVIFYLRSGINNADNSVFWIAIKICLPYGLLIFTVLYAIFYDISFGKTVVYNKKKKQIYPFKKVEKHRKKITVLIFIISVIILACSVSFFNYIIYNNFESSFIEENYVDPSKTNITFDEKRNLVFIVVESLETSLFTKEQGGYWNYNVTPELYKLLNDEDSITFYNENKAQNMNMIQGASWTTASVVANSTGLPFKIRINKNGYHSKDFMSGAYALGDLLKDNGYYNEAISGAKTSFGGLKEYFTKHGEYEIIDIKSLENYGFSMTPQDKGKWGFNDNYLFEIAKQRLNTISQYNQPFNLELVTIDTHFVDGFVGNYSETKFKDQYENAYATTSRLIYEFVNWIKAQPYYENTTIVIVGDHLSMQNEFFNKRKAKNRYVYSCIINPRQTTINNKGRITTALDSYPTIVSAIGGNIEGNKLGLGVNLFSNEKTLAEKYGVKALDKKLKRKSTFYNDVILNDEYLKKYEVGGSK